jgi:CheY-like chemotaxis protein
VSMQSILVVDDNPDHRKMFRSRLESGGYSVVEANSGREALAAIAKTRFALMILDLSMPDIDGFDVLQGIRATKRDLKIIVVSGFMHGKALASAKFLGADATLDKDQTSDLLLPMVRDLLKNPK